MLEEAKRRDHRKIGAEMGLFAIDTEFVGPGLPLWLPKGTAIVEELEKLAKETEFAAGYVRVKTPHIAKEKMYQTSGHLPYLRGVACFRRWNLIEEEADREARSEDRRPWRSCIDEATSTFRHRSRRSSATDEATKLCEGEYWQS